MALAVTIAGPHATMVDKTRTQMSDPIKPLVDYQREYFAILDEFFIRATGQTSSEFATVETFAHQIRSSAHSIAPRGLAAFTWVVEKLTDLYAQRGAAAFSNAKNLGGLKLVLGGGSRVHRSHLDSIQTSVLYCDTVLVPDPVLPWIEKDRSEERFSRALFLQAVHTLLSLKPLADADLPLPAVVVFPSWEKGLEERDPLTQQGISRMFANVIASNVGEKFETLEDIVAFADKESGRFCELVDQKHLLVAPGGPVEPLEQALLRYDQHLATWRSNDWVENYRRAPLHRRVVSSIHERVVPIYHLMANAFEFDGQPLMAIEQQAYYFSLVSQASANLLEERRVVDPRTTALVASLASRRLEWLARIPIKTLVELRRDNENLAFREVLTRSVERLQAAQLDDLNKVTTEVCHEISVAIGEHEKQVRAIQEKYKRVHSETALLAGAAVIGAFIPALTPFLGTVAPLALSAKYGADKVNELSDKAKLRRSVIGVLAATRGDWPAS